MSHNRRRFLIGLAGLITAPAIVRAGSLMPVKRMLWDPRLFTASAYVKENGEDWVRKSATFYADFINGECWMNGKKFELEDALRLLRCGDNAQSYSVQLETGLSTRLTEKGLHLVEGDLLPFMATKVGGAIP